MVVSVNRRMPLLEGAQRPYFFNATAVPLSLLAEKPLLFGPDLAVVPAGTGRLFCRATIHARVSGWLDS